MAAPRTAKEIRDRLAKLVANRDQMQAEMDANGDWLVDALAMFKSPPRPLDRSTRLTWLALLIVQNHQVTQRLEARLLELEDRP